MERQPAPDLEAMGLFVRIVRHGSLSSAGRALGVPKATLSRRLSELEQSLGCALLRRSTRAQSLTAAGRVLYDRVAPLLVEAERAASDIQLASEQPAGLVRVSAAVAFGPLVLMPILARFLAEFPKVRVDLSLSDDLVHIVDAGFDLAIRMGPLAESDLVARKLARFERKIVASPGYISAHGAPKAIADLERHFPLVGDPTHDAWQFDSHDGPLDVRLQWRLAAGGMMGLIEAARLGIGIALLPAYIADPLIATRELVGFDLGATPTSGEATALFPRSRVPAAAVRRLIDFIIAALAQGPLALPRSAPKTRTRRVAR
jgi:DNA-binding transcriptional LysR family regulator